MAWLESHLSVQMGECAVRRVVLPLGAVLIHSCTENTQSAILTIIFCCRHADRTDGLHPARSYLHQDGNSEDWGHVLHHLDSQWPLSIRV